MLERAGEKWKDWRRLDDFSMMMTVQK